jgi:alpha-L-fucosidase
MKAKLIFLSFAMLVVTHIMAQDFQVPVSERNEKMAQGKFQANWESLKNYEVPGKVS